MRNFFFAFELLTIICYRVKVFSSCAFLEKYNTKHLGASIDVYFYLSVYAAIINFKHGCRKHMIFQLIKGMLALVSQCK